MSKRNPGCSFCLVPHEKREDSTASGINDDDLNRYRQCASKHQTGNTFSFSFHAHESNIPAQGIALTEIDIRKKLELANKTTFVVIRICERDVARD